MIGVLVEFIIATVAVAALSTIPRIHLFLGRTGAWLAGVAEMRRADVRLGTFMGVFIAAAVILT